VRVIRVFFHCQTVTYFRWGMVKTATGQNGDKSKRRHTKTATGPK